MDKNVVQVGKRPDGEVGMAMPVNDIEMGSGVMVVSR